jgi:chromate transport protein ChrA
LSDSEFADIVSLCQFLPGPNIVGNAVCVGTKMRGAIGAVAALCGFLVIPWTVGFSLGLSYLKYSHVTVILDILGGIAATAAALLIATWHKALNGAPPPTGSLAFRSTRLQSYHLRQSAAPCGFVRSSANQYFRRQDPKRERAMTCASAAPLALTAHLALLSSISFGGFPTVLPDLRNFVVATHRWITDHEFTSLFAMAQSTPGPNMILMMSFIGWKVWGSPRAVVSAFATIGPPS